jgi:hypothetical protein
VNLMSANAETEQKAAEDLEEHATSHQQRCLRKPLAEVESHDISMLPVVHVLIKVSRANPKRLKSAACAWVKKSDGIPPNSLIGIGASNDSAAIATIARVGTETKSSSSAPQKA